MPTRRQTREKMLAPLSLRGCHLPATAYVQARLTRSEVFGALWPTVASDEEKQQALIVACNFYSEATWWVDHRHEAKACISGAVAVLCRLRWEATHTHVRDTDTRSGERNGS